MLGGTERVKREKVVLRIERRRKQSEVIFFFAHKAHWLCITKANFPYLLLEVTDNFSHIFFGC